MYLFKVLVFIGVVFFSSELFASNYPPGYVVLKNCKTNGEVEVCALNRMHGRYGFPRISVKYKGYLIEEHWGRISAFIRLNGRQGVFKMNNLNFQENVSPGDPRPYMCLMKDSTVDNPPPTKGQFEWCKYSFSDNGGSSSITWEVTPIPQGELDLYFYTYTEYGVPNAWDIELAFITDNGIWDSKLGQNYKFRFEE